MDLGKIKENTSREPYEFNHENMARRALKNTALIYLASLNEPDITELALSEYKSAQNMTDQIAALAQNLGDVREEALSDFYKKWEHDFLAYSLIGGFCAGSPVNFHAKDGSGYEFLGDIVLQLDKLNPQVASRMVSFFSKWKRFDKERQALSKAQLEKIVSANGLSENVFEIASKSLAA